jgi:hypothetical protein
MDTYTSQLSSITCIHIQPTSSKALDAARIIAAVAAAQGLVQSPGCLYWDGVHVLGQDAS